MTFRFVFLEEFIRLIRNRIDKDKFQHWKTKALELRGIYDKDDGHIYVNLESDKFKELSIDEMAEEIKKTICHEYSHKGLSTQEILRNEEILIGLLNKQLPDTAFPHIIIGI